MSGNPEYKRKWAREHPENIKRSRQKTQSKPEYKEYMKAYREAHKEEARQYSIQWRAKNREKLLEAKRIDYETHKEHYLELAKQWGNENPEKRREIARRWSRLHPEQGQVGHSRRRSKVKDKRFSVKFIQNLLIEQKYLCYYCKAPIAFNYHIEHKCPIVRGGTNAIENIALACPFCNQSKGSKTEEEFVYGSV